MKFEVVLSEEANATSTNHLLQHYRKNKFQEDLCFGLWRPSTGSQRYSAILYDIILPKEGERILRGNAGFQPEYLLRAIKMARKSGAGLAFMHSHPGEGWQAMSQEDVTAEKDVLAYPAGSTGLPLVGLTLGSDGYWSSRFWKRSGADMRRYWSTKTRVVGLKSYKIYHNDQIDRPPDRQKILKRTFDTWGEKSQNLISRTKIGIVGLGSVGSIVAESVARIGVSRITLVDPDKIEEHNLDRLLNATLGDIGEYKVEVAAKAIHRSSTAINADIVSLPVSVHTKRAYRAMLDCDLIFSCVDRPLARDTLNYIAKVHIIPVIDGGVAVESDPDRDQFFTAHWRAQIVTPYNQCLQCSGQYSSSDVVMELDGSLTDPSYIKNSPISNRNINQNVFPFSLSVASLQVNLMIRYIVSQEWWPLIQHQEYQYTTANLKITAEKCQSFCLFQNKRYLKGDNIVPFYIQDDGSDFNRKTVSTGYGLTKYLKKMLDKVFRRF